MKLWTIQEEPVWRRAQEAGFFDADLFHPGSFGRDFMFAYEWMFHQMRFRMPTFTGKYPVWAWLKRPDLRRVYNSGLGVGYVLLELEVPDHQVLISDFHTWHDVLNQGYLATAEEEADETFYDEGGGDDLKTFKDMIQSWERVFEVEGKEYLQACIDGLKPEHVVSVQKFRGRPSGNSIQKDTKKMSLDQNWSQKEARIATHIMGNESTDGLMPSHLPYSSDLTEAMRVLCKMRANVHASQIGSFFIIDHPDGYMCDVEGFKGTGSYISQAIVNCAINWLDWRAVRKADGNPFNE